MEYIDPDPAPKGMDEDHRTLFAGQMLIHQCNKFFLQRVDKLWSIGVNGVVAVQRKETTARSNFYMLCFFTGTFVGQVY